MLRHLRVTLALATLAGALLFGGSNRAEAGLRITLSGAPSGTLVFFANTTGTPISLATPTFGYGGYTGDLLNALSNFPGGIAGTLSTTFNVSATAAGASAITINSAVVDNVAGLAASTIYTSDPAIAGTTALTAGQLTSVNASPLSNFAAPVGSVLTLSADVGRAINVTVTSGLAQTTTTSNGLNVLSGLVPIVGLDPAFNTGAFANPNAFGLFNLQQTLSLSGVNAGASGYSVTASSSVTVPEPTSLALGLIGAFTAAGAALRRKLVSGQQA